jgi:hypothetical protein
MFCDQNKAELYDMGERNGGRPASEGTKTPCSTLVKFKSVYFWKPADHTSQGWENRLRGSSK